MTFVLSVKDKNGYDRLVLMCKTGLIVDLLLEENEREECMKSEKKSLFRLSLCETEDGKSGTLTCLYNIKTGIAFLCSMGNKRPCFSYFICL